MSNKCLIIKSPSEIDADLLKYNELRVTYTLASGQGGNTYGIKGSETLHAEKISGNSDIVRNDTNNISVKNNTSADDVTVISVTPLSSIIGIDTRWTRPSLITHIETLFGEDLEAVKYLTSLTTLELGSTSVTGDISNLKNLTSLTTLELGFTSVTGDISNLKNLTSLTTLELGSTSVTGDISNLKNLTSLTDLQLDSTSVTGDISNLKGNNCWLNLGFVNGTYGDVSSLRGINKITGGTSSGLLYSYSSSSARSTNGEVPIRITNGNRTGYNMTFGDDIDNLLIDNAACVANGTNSRGKGLAIRGTRTSASDDALTTLQNAGITVTIQDM